MNASAFVAAALTPKPQLVVHDGNLPATVDALRDVFAKLGAVFDRGGPVKVIKSANGSVPMAAPLTKESIVMEAHRVCEVVKISNGSPRPVTLPERVGRMYLDARDWGLPSLAGISTAPLLAEDGSIRTVEGYDPTTGLWCAHVLPVDLPERPTINDAIEALDLLRNVFRTFPFADAIRCRKGALDVVDLNRPPEQDESAFLVALLTADDAGLAFGLRQDFSLLRQPFQAPAAARGSLCALSMPLLSDNSRERSPWAARSTSWTRGLRPN